MLSQTAKYALHITSYLVTRQGERAPGGEIAEATGIPVNYLSKILNQLRKSGIVDSRKGWHGGFRIRAKALERPIRDILATIDGLESTQRTDCILGFPECNLDNPCPLHGYWESIRDTFMDMMSEMRIGDLAAQTQRGRRGVGKTGEGEES